MSKQHYPQSWVKAGSNGWVSTKLVYISNVEETLYGDKVTFTYNNVEYQSSVVSGSRPG